MPSLAPSEFEPAQTRGYLDTASYGLPPRSTVAALHEAVEAWRARASWKTWERDGEACRALFAGLVGSRAEDVAILPAASVAAGIVAASLDAGPGDNVVLYERDFTSTMLPWQALASRGVELRLLPLERLAEGVDERTAVVAVSLVQSGDGRVADLAALRETGARLFVDATQAVGAVPVDATGADYLVAHGYKWLLCPRGLTFLHVGAERRAELAAWTGGWKSSTDPYADYYGLPELSPDARRLDVSLAWFSVAGGRHSLELLAEIGIDRVVEHALALARRFAAGLGRPEPASPIACLGLSDPATAVERLRAAGIACSVRSGSVRLCFHLYNDEHDVDLAVEALAPAARVFDP